MHRRDFLGIGGTLLSSVIELSVRSTAPQPRGRRSDFTRGRWRSRALLPIVRM